MRRGSPVPELTPNESEVDPAEDRLGIRLEVWIAVGLGLAAILTALSIYLTDVHDDNAQVEFNDGVSQVTKATGSYVEAAQQRGADEALFVEFAQAANAGAQGDKIAEESATYLQAAVMRPELQKAVAWWGEIGVNQGLNSPFTEENPYFKEPLQDEANAQSQEAEASLAEAQDEQNRGDTFIIADVIVAASLFMFGIAAVARVTRLKIAMTAIGYSVFLVSLGVVIAGL
jgi:hypothetical protein